MPKSGNLSDSFVTTWTFTACFAVWTMFGITGIPIHAEFNLDSTQLGLLTATPVLGGALFRLPLGVWADGLGRQIIMLFLTAREQHGLLSDNQVDPATGTIRLAEYDNKGNALWPGLAVTTGLQLGAEKVALIVAADVVQHD